MGFFEIVGRVVACSILAYLLFGFYALASMKIEVPKEVPFLLKCRVLLAVMLMLPMTCLRMRAIPKGITAISEEDYIASGGVCPCPDCRRERGE